MTVYSLIFFILSPIFASAIGFTPQQCERFKADGISGGDYYINQALARDCGIQPQADDEGYFMPMVLNEDHQTNCSMKNLGLNDSNTGYLQDVVTFNNMHPDYFYPDREDDYPFVFYVQTPAGGSSGVAVDIDSIMGCRSKIESILNTKLTHNNIVLTTSHSFIMNKGDRNCKVMNKSETNKTNIAAGPDITNKPFVSKVEKVICSIKSCNEIKQDGYKDFCIIIPETNVNIAAKYERLNPNKLNEKSYLVAYQPRLVSALRNKNIKVSERMISLNKDGHLLQNKNRIIHSNNNFILHHADSAKGASGGGLFNENKKIFGLNTAEGLSLENSTVQRGLKFTEAVNYAIDPQIACQQLTTVLN